jgi:glycosyltransferase involved in cell wall biosynthesis
MQKRRFGIYIPAYKAGKTICDVLDRIPVEVLNEAALVLIVDNFSNDGTEQIVMQYKFQKKLDNLSILTLPKNLGYGGSQKIGYSYFLNKKIDVVAMLHSDGQYAPELLRDILTPVFNTEYHMVFGSRISGNPLKGGMPIHRFIGNRSLTFLQNLFLNTNLSEFHSGYRVYDTHFLSMLNFENLSDDYHFDTEILILHINASARLKEMPIPTFYGDEENYVNIWSYGLKVLITTFSYCLHKFRLRKSKNWTRIMDKSCINEYRSTLSSFIFDIRLNGEKNQDKYLITHSNS